MKIICAAVTFVRSLFTRHEIMCPCCKKQVATVRIPDDWRKPDYRASFLHPARVSTTSRAGQLVCPLCFNRISLDIHSGHWLAETV
jgi:hypothetical protein